ncbi:hypothetical protein [Anaerobacillus sp. 1_MG-2023]|uniref:hypothetical protein n=1 Tax=Anaerobacillus sp. 1_MG-2023 TaxID=3062655 RepID=UPI0026E2EDA8|nr:hypothetical protein [Anaerobacillus sp. 1_MG-2023]MDO6654819.1 hypothetical protein [Anaerobacillus sp. 1_MG-2023]
METSFSNSEQQKFVRTLQSFKENRQDPVVLEELLSDAAVLIDQNNLESLYQLASDYDQAGIFEGGPWEEPRKLQPPLVGGSFKIDGNYSIFEVLSELRMLAIAKEEYTHPDVTSDQVRTFLNKVMALNLQMIFPAETEEARINQGQEQKRGMSLFQFLAEKMSLGSLSATFVDEIDRLTAQRPIMVKRIKEMIGYAENLLSSEDLSTEGRASIQRYLDSVHAPTELSQSYPDFMDYRDQFNALSEMEKELEAERFADVMRDTGLVSPIHAQLARTLAEEDASHLLVLTLGLTEKGEANLNEHFSLVKELILLAIYPVTAQSLYGLARMLERGVLSSPPVIPGLERIIEIDMLAEVEKDLMASRNHPDDVTPVGILLSGLLSVLGQPLGIGQGMNPTCQSARGISLWSQHDPGFLLELVARACRDGEVDISFEGAEINSSLILGGLAPDLHKELDAVSLILVPHLDRVYDEMMKRSAFRGEDGHKFVNPEFYGQWISKEFSSVINPVTGAVSDYEQFARLFYATHHPDYNAGHQLIYPNPVGIFVTTANADLLGLHAISIQRIAADSSGEMRVYFYNPNNDSGQDWGQGIKSTVRNHGEEEGEASLPFDQFLSRVYAYHYNPNEMGDLAVVPDELIDRVTTLAKESWGQKYQWADLTNPFLI